MKWWLLETVERVSHHLGLGALPLALVPVNIISVCVQSSQRNAMGTKRESSVSSFFFNVGPLLSLSWLVCCTRPSEQSFQSDVLLLLWLLLLFYQQSIDIIVNYFCVEKTDNNVSMQLVHCRSAPELSRLAKLQRIFVVQVNIWLVVIWLYVTKFGFVYTLT